MSDLISVIIPAYNAAARIKFTLESIIAQDYQNIEIIVVDDASNDNTEIIAREILASSARQFQIIRHLHNRGECASRNTGLENSNGKYICFVDADDLIRKNFISSLYDAIAPENCDIAFCGLTDRFTDGRSDKNIHLAKKNPHMYSGEKILLSKLMPSVVCCLYNFELLRNSKLMFHEGCSAGGDIEFITKALCIAEKIMFIPECLYIYVHHNEMGSIRDNNTQEKKLTRYEHNTQAQIRTAEFLLEHSKTERVRIFADKILRAKNLIRQLTIYAMRKDLTSYNLFREDEENLKTLKGALSFYVLINKAECFFKALIILLFPKLYYRMRAKL